jgi:hypothetical protein
MSWNMMAMGAALVFAFGVGCTTQPDLMAVSAMVRTDAAVTVNLEEIVKP